MASDGLLVGKVMKVHPEANAVDLVMTHNLSRIPMVQVMGGVGAAYLPEPTAPAKDGDIRPTGRVDIYAIVGHVAGVPIVLGFLKPQVTQVLFKGRSNFRVDRHASDVYSTLEDDGSLTMAWPNGTYLKVSEDPELEDLEGRDFDAKWKLERNTARAPTVRLVVKDGGGVEKARLNIAPDGSAQIDLEGNLVANVSGNITSQAAQWSHTGDFSLDGNMTGTGNALFDGTVQGDIDVVGGGKSLKTHLHPGVTSGGSVTGPPQ